MHMHCIAHSGCLNEHTHKFLGHVSWICAIFMCTNVKRINSSSNPTALSTTDTLFLWSIFHYIYTNRNNWTWYESSKYSRLARHISLSLPHPPSNYIYCKIKSFFYLCNRNVRIFREFIINKTAIEMHSGS